MITRAESAHTRYLCRLVERFNTKYYHTPLNLEKTYETVYNLIQSGVVFISDDGVSYDGFIGGTVVEDPFRDQTFLVEVGWYSESANGLRLLDRFVREGRNIGVDEVRVNHMDTSSPKIAGILQRKGFKFADASYALRI